MQRAVTYTSKPTPGGWWVEEDYTSDRGTWRIAYRIAPSGGQPVVAEVRVFPAVGEPGSTPGRWADGLSHKRIAALVPAGGVPVRQVLRKVSSTAALEAWRRHAAGADIPALPGSWTRNTVAGSPARRLQQAVWEGTADLRQLGSDLLLSLTGFTVEDQTEAKRPRPGRRGRPPVFYSRVARIYLEAVAQGDPTPNRTVGDALGVTAQQAAGFIIEARRRTLSRERILTRPAGRGVPGGELTDYGRSLLEQETT